MGVTDSPEQRVVVTGMGAITPLGENVDQTMEAVLAGETHIRSIREDILANHPQLRVHAGAPVDGFSLLGDERFAARLSEKDVRSYHRSAQFALWAGAEALHQSGLLVPDGELLIDESIVDRDRVAVRIGTGIGGGDEIGSVRLKIDGVGESKPGRVPPTAIMQILPERVASVVSMFYRARGPLSMVDGACATGNLNIADAARLIKLDEADVVIAGGAEAQLSPVGIALFDGTTALDGTDDMSIASSPFHKRAKGFVMGEGAGVLVLESLEHARRRGAVVLAELVGYGDSADAFHDTKPSGEGAERALRMAARNQAYEGIGYINAHATGTTGDAIELQTIGRVFSPDQIAGISSTKAMMGHLLGAAGAVESIVAIRAMLDSALPPTIKASADPIEETARWHMNFDTVRRQLINFAINNSFGFGGINSVTHWRRHVR